MNSQKNYTDTIWLQGTHTYIPFSNSELNEPDIQWGLKPLVWYTNCEHNRGRVQGLWLEQHMYFCNMEKYLIHE